jgi:tetratricopeptide (TPR) repeat protein
MDATGIKQLLASTDISALKGAIRSYRDAENDLMEDDKKNSAEAQRQQEQLCKLQIMLWSRVLTLLQMSSEAAAAATAVTAATTVTVDASKNNNNNNNNKGLVETYQNIGQVWMRLGDSHKAVGQFKKALAINRRHVACLELLSQALVNLSDYPSAIEHQQEAIRVLEEQEDHEMCDNGGGGDNGGNNNNNDNDEFRQDILVMAYTQLANIYECQGEFDMAVKLLKENLERIQIINRISSEKVHEHVLMDVYSRLGVIQTKLGHGREAAVNLQHAHAWHVQTRGEKDSKTQEMAFLLDLALTS